MNYLPWGLFWNGEEALQICFSAHSAIGQPKEWESVLPKEGYSQMEVSFYMCPAHQDGVLAGWHRHF